MQNISFNTNVVDNGVGLLLSQFRDCGNVGEFVAAFLSEVQAAETAITPIISAMYVQNATGWTLTQIGKLVGVKRGILADDPFRVLIYAQIAANTSYGTLPDVYNVLRSLGLGAVRVWNRYPASITVNYIPNVLTLTCACVRFILESATLPISMDITEITETPFGFDGDPSAYGLGVGEIGAAG